MRYILDVSNIVHGAYHAPNPRYVEGFPVSGIRRILGLINASYPMHEMALCFDGGDLLKKELLPEYKSGRIPNYSVLAQIELLEEILTDCGIPYYKKPKYEADDFICSVVNMASRIGDTTETVIISDDQDLSCCVNDVTSIKGATSNGAVVNKSNYCDRALRKSGKQLYIPYNTSLVYKTLNGDDSDVYKALHLPGITFENLANDYVSLISPFIENGSFSDSAYFNYDVFCAAIEELPGNYSKESKQALIERGRIAFPYFMPVLDVSVEELIEEIHQKQEPLYRGLYRHSKIFGNGCFDLDRLHAYCSVLGLNRCRPSRDKDPFSDLHEGIREKLKDRAKALSDGSLAAEKYVSRTHQKAQPMTLPDLPLPL